MKRIIIADDSSMARMYVRRCLEIAGLRDVDFVEASNGEEVINHLRDKPADLVVTDLNMPIMDGTELLKRIKASPRLVNTPVLVITSMTNQKRVEELKELGVIDILGKPISPSVIADALTPFLDEDAGMTTSEY